MSGIPGGVFNLVGNLLDAVLGDGTRGGGNFTAQVARHHGRDEHAGPPTGYPTGYAPPPPPDNQLALMTPVTMAGLSNSFEPADERAIAEAQVARRAAAVAAALRHGGEIEAARELRGRTRDLPPALAAEVMVAARGTVEAIATRVVSTPPEPPPVGLGHANPWNDAVTVQHRPEPEPPMSVSSGYSRKREQAAADLAGSIAHAARDPRGETFARDMVATLLSGPATAREEERLVSFAQGIPFGTGPALPVLLADELARRGDARGQQQLLLAIAQGLGRLNERIAASVGGLVALAAPLVARAAAEGPKEHGAQLALLREHVRSDPSFLGNLAEATGRLDGLGADAFFALEYLGARGELALELQAARADLAANPATAFVIAVSATARDLILQRSRTSEPFDVESRPRQESVEQVSLGLGFSRTQSTLLADTICASRSTVMTDARWAAAQGTIGLEEAGRLFEALLRFLRPMTGTTRLRSVELSELERRDGDGRDDEGEADMPTGLSLLGPVNDVK